MKPRQLNLKFSKDMSTLVNSALIAKLEAVTIGIHNAILDKYDEELVDVVTDRESKTNPNFYREEFSGRLSEFTYIKKNDGEITLVVPDMENFDFSGRLRVIETIMSGLAGEHVEINEEDYVKVFGKKMISQDPLDEYISPKERIFLIRYTPSIRKVERDLNKKFARYPFSNTPPIEIFSAGQKFVDENMGRWIEEAIDKAQKTFVANYKGAKL